MLKKINQFLKHYFYLSIKAKRHPASEKELADQIAQNPYLQSRLLWNDIYGSVEKKWQYSRRLNTILIIIIVFNLLGFMHLAHNTRIQPLPFVIHGNEMITLDHPTSDLTTIQTAFRPYFAKVFIRAWRSYSTDTLVNRNNHIKSLAFVTNTALHQLQADDHEMNPSLASQSKTVHITSVLVLSKHTLEIRWEETSINTKTGKTVDKKNYIAELTTTYSPLTDNETLLKFNPLGFYITQLSWSLEKKEVL